MSLPLTRRHDLPVQSAAPVGQIRRPAPVTQSDTRRSLVNLSSLVLLGLMGFEVALSEVLSSVIGH